MKNTTSATTPRESSFLDVCIDTLDYCDDNLYDFLCDVIRRHGRESVYPLVASLAEYCYGLAERLLNTEIESADPCDERIEYLSSAMHFLEKA